MFHYSFFGCVWVCVLCFNLSMSIICNVSNLPFIQWYSQRLMSIDWASSSFFVLFWSLIKHCEWCKIILYTTRRFSLSLIPRQESIQIRFAESIEIIAWWLHFYRSLTSLMCFYWMNQWHLDHRFLCSVWLWRFQTNHKWFIFYKNKLLNNGSDL